MSVTSPKPIFKPGDTLVEVEKRYGGVYSNEQWSDLPEGFYYQNESDMLFGTSEGPKEIEHVNVIKPRTMIWTDYWSDLHNGKFIPSYLRESANPEEREKILNDLYEQIMKRKEDFNLWMKETGFDVAESEDDIRYLRQVRAGKIKPIIPQEPEKDTKCDEKALRKAHFEAKKGVKTKSKAKSRRFSSDDDYEDYDRYYQ